MTRILLPAALSLDDLLELAARAKERREVTEIEAFQLGEGVQLIAADLERERDSHQATTLELEATQADLVMARDACAIAEEDARQLRQLCARLRREIDDARAVPSPIDVAFDRACETITARHRKAVDASLYAEIAANPEPDTWDDTTPTPAEPPQPMADVVSGTVRR